MNESKVDKEYWYSNYEKIGGFLVLIKSENFIGINKSKYKISINIKQNACYKQQLGLLFWLINTAKTNQLILIHLY